MSFSGGLYLITSGMAVNARSSGGRRWRLSRYGAGVLQIVWDAILVGAEA